MHGGWITGRRSEFLTHFDSSTSIYSVIIIKCIILNYSPVTAVMVDFFLYLYSFFKICNKIKIIVYLVKRGTMEMTKNCSMTCYDDILNISEKFVVTDLYQLSYLSAVHHLLEFWEKSLLLHSFIGAPFL